MISGVYTIKNTDNGRLYVGSSTDIHARWNKHKISLLKSNHHNWKMNRDFKKHNIECFDFRVVLECDKENLIIYEQYIMDFYMDSCELYNVYKTARMPSRSYKAGERSKTWRDNLSKALKGRKPDPIVYEKLREAKTGKKESELTRLKKSISMTGLKRTSDEIARSAAKRTGAKRTPEQRKKIREATIAAHFRKYSKEFLGVMNA